ncbi:MAG: SLAC1 anion channel family protein [Thiotrichales bacterium]|nr:SLAC1 anion channel family protein [Thiotrichales bacterium]
MNTQDLHLENFNRLEYFPASIFGMVMGMAGLVISFFVASHFFKPILTLAQGGLIFVTALFAFLFAVYVCKTLRFRAAFLSEMQHPIKMNFGPTISIGLLLLSIAYLQFGYKEVSFYLWAIGSILQLLLTLWVLNHWFFHNHFEIHHSNPAWFIPIVGNIIVPIAGVEHANPLISWFFFSIGIVFWPVLKSILVYRIIFHPPIMDRLIPTLFIFIAPPAVGFISYVKLSGSIDGFAYVLYFFALFFTLFLASTLKHFKKLDFAISWWAYTFPLAAISIASFTMAKHANEIFFANIGFAIQAVLFVLVLIFAYRTLKAALNKKICDPSH